MFLHPCNYTTTFAILDKGPPNWRIFLYEMNIFSFLKEVREELFKVSWPSREQTVRYTILVIIVAVAVGLFLGGLDYLLTALTALVLK